MWPLSNEKKNWAYNSMWRNGTQLTPWCTWDLRVCQLRRTDTSSVPGGIGLPHCYIKCTLLCRIAVVGVGLRHIDPYLVVLPAHTKLLLPLEFTPAQYLLHHSSLPRSMYLRSLAMHMVTAARWCITVLWKTSKYPTVRKWYTRLDLIRKLEELLHATRNISDKFYKIWATWLHFKESAEYTNPV